MSKKTDLLLCEFCGVVNLPKLGFPNIKGTLTKCEKRLFTYRFYYSYLGYAQTVAVWSSW